jgi:hypothetical protein
MAGNLNNFKKMTKQSKMVFQPPSDDAIGRRVRNAPFCLANFAFSVHTHTHTKKSSSRQQKQGRVLSF